MNKILAGKKAKSYGDVWEDMFRKVNEINGYRVVEFPDGARTIHTAQGAKTIRQKIAFDFLVNVGPKVFAIDTKTVMGATFPHSSIRPHQVNDMYKLEGPISTGYVVWYRKLDLVIFHNVKSLDSLKYGKSLKPEDGIKLGKSFQFDLKAAL